jgi:multicomponent Na+:H+ antiporter subunit B
MIPPYDSVTVRTVAKLLVPFIQVFGLYVVFHGAKSPGGGFQGGAILAASLILTRLTTGPGIGADFLPGLRALRLGAVGVLAYAAVGLLPLFWGAPFLDYGAVPLPIHGGDRAEIRALGIEAVEVGVALAVCCVMLSIFDDLAPTRRPFRANAAEGR